MEGVQRRYEVARQDCCALGSHAIGQRKVLKPAEFQDFELEEKTVLSHNTAMYAYSIPLCST
jgi:hypothetical protein